MAVMGTMRQSIIFGGIDSADFGIYVSGEGVFDAPKRAVEMIAVPGRNGEIALDQGYWENIEVTYPAFNYEEDLDTFAERLSAFRNAICSLKGYQRLSDTFHPDEYRMAVYSEGLEVTPIKYNTAANFDLKFDCKPQRWLTEGETAVTVESGDTLTNPTQYAASPFLTAYGYGDIKLKGQTISISDGNFGKVEIVPAGTYVGVKYSSTNSVSKAIDLNSWLYNEGDIATAGTIRYKATFTTYNTGPEGAVVAVEPSTVYDYGDLEVSLSGTTLTLTNTLQGGSVAIKPAIDWLAFQSINLDITFEDGTTALRTVRLSASVQTDAVTFTVRGANNLTAETAVFICERITVDSSMYVIGPKYIDCETGEAYLIYYRDGVEETFPINYQVSFGNELPKLVSGANKVTYPSTITSLEVKPNWWKL